MQKYGSQREAELAQAERKLQVASDALEARELEKRQLESSGGNLTQQLLEVTEELASTKEKVKSTEKQLEEMKQKASQLEVKLTRQKHQIEQVKLTTLSSLLEE